MNAVKIAMKLQDDDLTHGILYADYLASKNVGDDVSYNNSLPAEKKKLKLITASSEFVLHLDSSLHHPSHCHHHRLSLLHTE